MAKVLLDVDEVLDPNSGNFEVVGAAGIETVNVYDTVVANTDASVERLQFEHDASAFTYQATTTGIKVILNGSTVAYVQVGSELAFTDGSALVGGAFDAVTGITTYSLGGATVSTTAGVVVPTLNTAAGEASTIGDSAPPPPPPTQGQSLTTGQDNIVGTAGDNLFTAGIVDNSNTLQNGDTVNGGSGTDTLNAEVGNSQEFAIQPRINDVEKIFIQAQTTAWDSSDNFLSPTQTYNYDTEQWEYAATGGPLGDMGAPFSYNDANFDGATQIDAGKIVGVRELWTDDSRANLVIEDVSVNSHETTIGMRDTDPGNVNYEVYFDPQNITSREFGNTESTLFLDILDQLPGHTKLQQHSYVSFSFDYLGETYTIVDLQDAETYEALRTLIEEQINAIPALSDLEVTRIPDGFTDNDGLFGDRIVITSTDGNAIIPTAGVPATGPSKRPGTQADDTYAFVSNQEGSPIPALTSVKVILDNVARGDASGSGDLVIGDMSESGIQQFYVQVQNSSHIDQLASTNNVLEVVTVENIAIETAHNHGAKAAEGNLTINRLDDVRVFDATPMTGDVTLAAYLSKDVAGKYMDLGDTQTDPAEDNSEGDGVFRDVVDTQFSYDFGSGDDKLLLTVDKANLAAAGSTAREDFSLEINGNAGDDNITLQIGDNTGETPLGSGLGSSSWYVNSKLNANMTINTQSGDDIVRAYGAGDRVINTGSENDTVYIDNSGAYPSGRKAIWVYNTHSFDQESGSANVIDDQNGPLGAVGLGLLSDTNETYRMFHVGMTVSFMGFEATSVVPDINGHTTDLQINQAIKAAINGDAELSKLLRASDGPANTLVITSLIDGDMDEYSSFSAPTFTLTAPTAASLNASNVVTLGAAYGDATPSAAEIVAEIQSSIDAFNLRGDYVPEYAETSFGAKYTGVNSVLGVGDNTITGGTGNDVIVLGTRGDDRSPIPVESFDSIHNTLDYSNDTIVYTGYGNGLDTVVNFQFGHNPDTASFAIVDIDTVAYFQGTPFIAAGPVTNIYEQFTAQFKAADTAGPVTFDGVTINMLGTETADQVAAMFVAQSASFLTYTAALGSLAGTVVFTANAANAGVNLNDAEVTDFTVSATDTTPTATGVILAVIHNVDGEVIPGDLEVLAATETFTLRFGDATANGVITFDGEQINVLNGETGYDIAQAVQTGTYTNWNVISDGNDIDNQVTFQYKIADVVVTDVAAVEVDPVAQYQEVAGETTYTTTDDFDPNTAPFVVPTYTVTSEMYYANVDYLDFSDYITYADRNATINGAQYDLSDATFGGLALSNNTVSILNNPALGDFNAADLATTNLALDQIYMVESNAADQNGRYEIFHVSHAASSSATAVTVVSIGTIDFGAELTANGWVV